MKRLLIVILFFSMIGCDSSSDYAPILEWDNISLSHGAGGASRFNG